MIPFHLAGRNNVVIELRAGTTSVWNKPKSARLIAFVVVGRGGNGGNGFTRVAGSAGGGGGGGAAGNTTTALFAADFVPDELYIFVPESGSATSASVRYRQTLSSNNTLVLAANGGNGGNGTGAAAGTAGSGAGGSALTSAITGRTAYHWLSFGTASGSAGGAQTGATPTARQQLTSANGGFIQGGMGGAGCTTTDFAGGSYTAYLDIAPPAAGGATAGGRGEDGFINWKELSFGAGAGGGSNNSGTAGNGGNGAPGCGGGGGGAGTTGGTGGRGGDGFVIIAWI